MAELTVVTPSRGRPEAVRPLVEAFRATCTADTDLLIAVDTTDPRLHDYVSAIAGDRVGIVTADSRNMVEALNRAVSTVRSWAVGFMGDDHCPRTHGWDTAYLEALRELRTGIVYGNDLLQGQNLPTQAAMTGDIPRTLGYIAPPGLTHLYVDNFWRDLGRGAGCLRYLPDVVVEHRHPLAGKGNWDEHYARVNDSAMYARDEAAYRQFVDSGEFEAAVQAIKGLR